jgi:hypothetical protein
MLQFSIDSCCITACLLVVLTPRLRVRRREYQAVSESGGEDGDVAEDGG